MRFLAWLMHFSLSLMSLPLQAWVLQANALNTAWYTYQLTRRLMKLFCRWWCYCWAGYFADQVATLRPLLVMWEWHSWVATRDISNQVTSSHILAMCDSSCRFCVGVFHDNDSYLQDLSNPPQTCSRFTKPTAPLPYSKSGLRTKFVSSGSQTLIVTLICRYKTINLRFIGTQTRIYFFHR